MSVTTKHDHTVSPLERTDAARDRGAVACPPADRAALARGEAPLTIERIQDVGGFAALASEWDELLVSSKSDCIFLTREWVFTWWKYSEDRGALQIIAVRRGTQLIAIVPLVLTAPRPARLLPFRTLEFLGSGIVGSDYQDLLIRRGEERAVIRALTEHLADCTHMIDLMRVRSTRTSASLLAGRLQRRGWFASRCVTDVCPYIDLTGHTWESYLARLGPTHRRSVRRKTKAVFNKFAVRFECARTEAELDRSLAIFAELHRRRWAGKRDQDAFQVPGVMDFHKEWSHLALANDWLRLYTLWLDDRPAASVYGLEYNGTFYYFQAGYDPEFARFSVGLVALGLSIRGAIEGGLRKYDMLHGDEKYKYLWARERQDLVRLNLFPPNTQGEICRKTMQVREVLKRLGRFRSSLPSS